jgi:trk system potassium uptake protein TrkA
MKVAVVGLGTYGRAVALDLARSGVEVIAVDENMELVAAVKDEVFLAVRLNATDERELRAQGIDNVDALVACMGDSFEANQLLVLHAKKMGIPRVLARARSPIHARILHLIGVDDVIMPEEQAALDTARKLLQPSIAAYIQLVEGISIMELRAPIAFHGQTIQQLDLRERFNVSLVAIFRGVDSGKRVATIPSSRDTIQEQDVLVVCGRDGDLQNFASMAS